MPIPKHNELRVPVLEFLKKNGVSTTKEMVIPLSEYFRLNPEEVSQMYESGNGPIFRDRISWAITYLGFTDLISKPKRGVYEITPKGIEMLKTPEKIEEYVDVAAAARDSLKSNSESTTSDSITTEITSKSEKATPQEKLYQSYANIKKTTKDEILETILSKTPGDFEKLVVSLLQRMGYGGEIKDSGTVTKATNDKGIDGIIKEDILGLGRIYIQSKRYALDNSIGREEIQKFVGALAVAQSNKGVFITTSSFKKTAIDYVNSLNGATTIVLIDGEQLAEYIYEFELGMQVEQVIKIKKLDSDFWDAMQDDE
ncbi:MAG: restriction endonuclease [Bacteroidetes bacterium]|nr:restriction endonuclease [Bacteroidota bacterium]